LSAIQHFRDEIPLAFRGTGFFEHRRDGRRGTQNLSGHQPSHAARVIEPLAKLDDSTRKLKGPISDVLAIFTTEAIQTCARNLAQRMPRITQLDSLEKMTLFDQCFAENERRSLIEDC
jgi:hypothetical protein